MPPDLVGRTLVKKGTEFYIKMLKPQYRGLLRMEEEKKYPEKISSLADGHYCGVMKRVSRYDLKDGRGFFINFYMDINGKEYEYGQFVTEKNDFILYNNFLIPLGCYASKRGIDEVISLKDLYVEFDKETKGQYANVRMTPLFECKKNAPVGSKNTCIETEDIKASSYDLDDIPY